MSGEKATKLTGFSMPTFLEQRKVIMMIGMGLSCNGIGNLTDGKWDSYFQIYLYVLDNNAWPVVVRYFADNKYIFRDDYAHVYHARITYGKIRQFSSFAYVAI